MSKIDKNTYLMRFTEISSELKSKKISCLLQEDLVLFPFPLWLSWTLGEGGPCGAHLCDMAWKEKELKVSSTTTMSILGELRRQGPG